MEYKPHISKKKEKVIEDLVNKFRRGLYVASKQMKYRESRKELLEHLASQILF